ncbi:antitoxin [Microlunatus antarcticus]|uniref:Arc/MetJ-type ribon-helix-helix transcriptional regulator n=1 Tax=Microlunatus antarcticus TaxID=53388 RepID=A0A7W5P6X1_9ACTN|nr:antitoxin [Microlunatus antarcticus]MBB3326782.1 Arc/MetJ-type ribon-helix-helix transcriptional regulator [Microlunatus antarcticus]
MSTQMTVRLSDEAAAFIDQQVAGGAVASRAAALDKLVRREIRRERAAQDALIYARAGEDHELEGFHEAAARRRLAHQADLAR